MRPEKMSQLDMTSPDPELEGLLNVLGLVPETVVQQLTGATETTLENWHRRYQGPTRIRLGNKHYYHRPSLKRFIDLLADDRNAQHSDFPRGEMLLTDTIEPIRSDSLRKKKEATGRK